MQHKHACEDTALSPYSVECLQSKKIFEPILNEPAAKCLWWAECNIINC